MKPNTIKFLLVLLALATGGTAWAQETTWTGAAGDGLWSTPGNWSAGVPLTNPPTTGNTNLPYVANYPVINVTTNVDCGSGTVRPSDLHGPNFGATLNIDGAAFIHRGFVMASVASDPALRSTINVLNGGQFDALNLCLGDTWWYTAPFVTLNVYDTSTVNIGDFLWLGGYMNLYGGTVNITNGFNMAANVGVIEGFGEGLTRLDIEAGTLIIGADYTTQVSDWIAAGYLTAYGLTPGEGADILVDTTTVPGSTIITARYSYPATAPTPGDGSIGAGTLQPDNTVDVTLNWTAGADPNAALTGNPFNPDILVHYVYLSDGPTDPNLYYEATVPQTSPTDPEAAYTATGLAENTVYYWRIEEGLDDGTGVPYQAGDPNNIGGTTWSFQTRAAVPNLLGPDDALADPHAVLTVLDNNGVATGYQWYKVGTPDIALEDDATYAGTDTPTLTVSKAGVAEEGQYYCIAYNGTQSDASKTAYLWTPRLMGHWKMDGNLLDSVAETVPGAPTHDGAIGANTVVGSGDPNFAAAGGPDGSGSIRFFNDGDYVAIEDPDFFNFYPFGFTVSFWYKENAAVGWRLPLSKLDPGQGGWLFGVDQSFRDWILFFSNPEPDPAFWADGSPDIDLGDGQWHMVTAVFDPDPNTITVFTDGDEDESVVFDLADNPLPAAPLSIGGRASEASVDGYIDDVRIYSRVLTPLQIAQLYLASGQGDWICVEDPDNPLNGFDVNGDCRVNLDDFAEFAARWLACQRYPDSFCW